MIPKTLFVIGANIVIIAHVQSFVLLTANFEDVKKLAQKFVSDSLAEKIAEFVAKASGNQIAMKTLKEDEVKMENNVEADSISEENKSETKESISKENIKYKLKAKRDKTRFKPVLPASSESISKNHLNKENIPQPKVNKKLKFKFLPENNNKLDDYSEDSAANKGSIESTVGWIEEGVLGKNMTSSQEESDSDYVFRNNNEGKNEEGAKETTLTTRKEKNEFDQYDNTYYPKAIATSGSVTLRLLDSRKSRYRRD